jgi:hypothetical protein
MRRRTFLYFTAVAATGAAAGGLVAAQPSRGGPIATDEIGDQVQTVPRGQLPEFARSRGPGGRDAAALYRYAVEHGDGLRSIPCFCGCARFGHTSNRDCYIKSMNADGTITFTSHAAT